MGGVLMNLNSNSIIKRNPEIVHSDMDGEVVMMSVANGEYYGVDTIGSHIWNLLEEPMSIGALCTSLCETYDVSEEDCQRDVASFMSQLLENKVVLID